MPTVAITAYILNNSFCIIGTEVQIDCDTFNVVGSGYFVYAENTIPDGCGGYKVIGQEIPENQTIGFENDVDYLKLIHITTPSGSYWTRNTEEYYRSQCKCNMFNQDWAVAVSDKTTPITTFSDQLLFWTTRVMMFSRIMASLDIPQSAGVKFTVDVKVNGVSVFSTLLTFDNGYEQTNASTVPSVLSMKEFLNNAKVTCDVTQVGIGDAAGLIIYFVA